MSAKMTWCWLQNQRTFLISISSTKKTIRVVVHKWCAQNPSAEIMGKVEQYSLLFNTCL